MAITSEAVELRRDNIRAGVPFSVDIRVMDETEVQVAYGPDRTNAIRGLHYTVFMESDGRFTVTPTVAFLELIGQDNTVLVRRELNFLSDFRAEDAFIRERVEQAVDRTVMRDQQLSKRITDVEANVIDALGTIGEGEAFADGRQYDFGFVFNVNTGFTRDFGFVTDADFEDDANVISGNIDNGVA